MPARLLDCAASDFAAMGKAELVEAIRASEGRTLVCECVGDQEPMLVSVTNAELVASMGADLILLNALDLDEPIIRGLPSGTAAKDAIRVLKRLTGRPVGVNLEPVDQRYANRSEALSAGRLATESNARRAVELGIDMIVLTGNPGVGVSNQTIREALAILQRTVGDRVVLAAGKMHAAGVSGESATNILTVADIDEFVSAGADIVLLPAPGTVPGITLDIAHRLISHAHTRGALTMTAVGTSQEGSDEATVRQFALAAKMAGTDLHHLGDAGYGGSALPENVLAYSITIRGRRHTYARMARSVNR